jgi:adenine-specific DNA-methyltransferase
MMLEKLDHNDPLTRSPDVVAENIAALKELFPELVTEGPDGARLNIDVLKALVADATVTDADEKYGLNWHGKRLARYMAFTPSTGTLRPCPGESVDWDTTQNLLIEGENLEVLKLLQKGYAGRIKLIYIDPRYNTGNDFVYLDDFKDNLANYLMLTGQIESTNGQRITSNAEASGRFHTHWLNMLYPRLLAARDLLRDDGAILVSVDDHEICHARLILNDVFGEENFICNFVWKRWQISDNRNKNNVSIDHEYIPAYGKPNTVFNGTAKDLTKYKNPDNDPRGPWMSDNLTGLANRDERPNLHFDLVNPVTGISYPPSSTRGWAYEPATMSRLVAEGRILWPASPDGRPRLKRFLNSLQNHVTGFSSIQDLGFTTDGTRELEALFGEKIFPFPKPLSVPRMAIEQCTSPNGQDIVLDFFAGSGTTGQAVFEANSADNGNRRIILVQLPEPSDHKQYSTISDIAKERLRRAGKKIREENLI